MRKLTKEGLHRTDKRVSLMNEILAAMDVMKYGLSLRRIALIFSVSSHCFDSIMKYFRCYAWEKSFQSRIQSVRDDELSWFRGAQLLSAVWNKLYILLSYFVAPSLPRMCKKHDASMIPFKIIFIMKSRKL